MSEQWLGLHNFEQHEPDDHPSRAWCLTCDGVELDDECRADHPCHCCLTEERTILATANEVLRAQVAREFEKATPKGKKLPARAPKRKKK